MDFLLISTPGFLLAIVLIQISVAKFKDSSSNIMLSVEEHSAIGQSINLS